VQVRRWSPSIAIVLGLGLGLASPCAAADATDPDAANGLMRVFSDSKHVSVRSFIQDVSVPLGSDVGLTLHWNNEHVTVAAIQAAAGSQEAVDAITTASRPIHGNAFQDFAKTRNEFQGQLSRGDMKVDYYHSVESDYLARQLGAEFSRDVRGDQLNLSVGSSYGWDDIDPLSNDNNAAAADHKTTLHLSTVATQILSPTTLVRVGIEGNIVDGLQHNPYRRVYAGGTSVPEQHPRTRDRRDAFVKINHYLQNRSSVRLDYRFYTDDWGVLSHETSTQLSQYLTHGMFAQYEYRYYTQTAADFYRPEYASTTGIGGYLTGDYRLGPLSSHLFGVTLNFDLGQLAADTPALRRFNLSLDYERYFNNNNYSADILETGIDFRF
jgi:uncharacterized protein DUF3570